MGITKNSPCIMLGLLCGFEHIAQIYYYWHIRLIMVFLCDILMQRVITDRN